MESVNFVPADFEVPHLFETDLFRLRMLSVDDVEKDYDAVMESQEMLRTESGSWPREGFTVEENLADLERHQGEFLRREAFAYTVVSLDESRVLGCVYINPPRQNDCEAEVFLWARRSEQKNGLDLVLYQTVKRWLDQAWPFEAVAFPGRE